MIAFDIETGGLPWGELVDRLPAFDREAAVPHPGEFDPASVKTGNLKDQAKIDAKVAEARAEHGRLVGSIEIRRAEAYNEFRQKQMEKAALSPLTGRVLAIGYFVPGSGTRIECLLPHGHVPVPSSEVRKVDSRIQVIDWFPTEAELLRAFWAIYTEAPNEAFAGHNIGGFDLPFLVVRSYLLRVDVPNGVVTWKGKWPNWSYRFVDTMDRWGFGRNMPSLADVSQACGGPGKPEGTTGADFQYDWEAGGDRLLKALSYLAGDMEMTGLVADRCGIL